MISTFFLFSFNGDNLEQLRDQIKRKQINPNKTASVTTHTSLCSNMLASCTNKLSIDEKSNNHDRYYLQIIVHNQIDTTTTGANISLESPETSLE